VEEEEEALNREDEETKYPKQRMDTYPRLTFKNMQMKMKIWRFQTRTINFTMVQPHVVHPKMQMNLFSM
jgi:hypothetical protein